VCLLIKLRIWLQADALAFGLYTSAVMCSGAPSDLAKWRVNWRRSVATTQLGFSSGNKKERAHAKPLPHELHHNHLDNYTNLEGCSGLAADQTPVVGDEFQKATSRNQNAAPINSQVVPRL